MVTLTIRFDPATGQINIDFPPNFVLSLGMLEAAREIVLTNQVRPSVIPKIVAGTPMPRVIGRGD